MRSRPAGHDVPGSYAVLVLDPWQRPSLAAVRALGRADSRYHVGVAGTEPSRARAGLAANSRWVRWYDVLPDPTGPAAPFGAALAEVVARRGYDIVVATSDATVARLATLDLPVPTFPRVGTAWRALTDKVSLASTCAREGVPYPVTRAVEEPDNVAGIVAELGLPLVVKSDTTAHATPDSVEMARGARVCPDVASAERAVAALRSSGFTAVLQPRVPFDEKVNAVVVRTSTESFRYAHRVLREVPITGGMGVALETISATAGIGAEAADLLSTLCAAVGYVGLAQAEFYRSRTDGRLYLLDVNPRLWGSTWFAERLGQRVTERGIQALLSREPVDAPPYPVGRRFRTPLELRWLKEQPDKRAAVTALVRDVRRGDVYEFLDRRDPRPVAMMLLNTVTRRGHGRAI